jgi:hypothetical protein
MCPLRDLSFRLPVMYHINRVLQSGLMQWHRSSIFVWFCSSSTQSSISPPDFISCNYATTPPCPTKYSAHPLDCPSWVDDVKHEQRGLQVYRRGTNSQTWEYTTYHDPGIANLQPHQEFAQRSRRPRWCYNLVEFPGVSMLSLTTSILDSLTLCRFPPIFGFFS